MKISFLFTTLAAISILPAFSQNTGIGTSNPQRKLHVAGGLRIDTLAGTNSIMRSDPSGDVFSIPLTGIPTHVLKADGSFGAVSGIVPLSGIIGSKTYNNSTLSSAGYRLIGELPGYATYNTVSGTFPANTWEPTYVKGNPAQLSPPDLLFQQNVPCEVLWDGNIMYVLTGGYGMYSYNPGTDSWASFNFNNIPAFMKAVYAPPGFILWNGQTGEGNSYNLTTNTFAALSNVNAPFARTLFSMLFTGSKLIIWGGKPWTVGQPLTNTGAVYDIATDTWTAMSTAGAPEARANHTATWCSSTGRMVVWGGYSQAGIRLNTGGIYDPVTNTWTGATSLTGAPAARENHTATWTGTAMIIFGGNLGTTVLNTGAIYNPGANTWTTISAVGAPNVRNHGVSWGAGKLFVAGGSSNDVDGSNILQWYTESTNSWSAQTLFGEAKLMNHCFYKNNMIVVWGGRKKNIMGEPFSNTGYRYFLENTVSTSTNTSNPATPLYLFQR
jgi:hypothetical protein